MEEKQKKKFLTVHVEDDIKELLDYEKLLNKTTYSDVLRDALKKAGYWEEYLNTKEALKGRKKRK